MVGEPMVKINLSVITFVLVSLVACSKFDKLREPEVTVPVQDKIETRVELGDSIQTYQVLGSHSLLSAIKTKEVRGVGNRKIKTKSLVLSFPKKLIGENFVFGGVVTQVSDVKNATLGNLKLSDFPPVFVNPVLSVKDNQFSMDLNGCLQNCDELSSQETVISLPIVALDEVNDRVVVDLSVLGEKLNLIKMMDPNGEDTQLKTKTSEVVSMDFSASTLVFDVKISMVPIQTKAGENPEETDFTVRWYLRLGSVFNPAFVSREKTSGVGYFMTERGRVPKIIRHGLTHFSGQSDQGVVKYYLKNIPEDHKESFKLAFDAWNQKFIETTGRKLIRYEFVDIEDPRSKFLIPGDIRYNILEWDLVNDATYGGLGPSIANQFTGEILSSNILVQGPRIIEIYQKWFKVSEKIQELQSQGREFLAQEELKSFLLSREIETRKSKGQLKLTLQGKAGFNIHSQDRPYEDPVIQKEDFDLIPVGVSYEDYMRGYFMDLVAHELGHNLGLRHNFKGNLSAGEGDPQQGKVSVSIMEYLGRSFRYLDEIGPYDAEAIKYGYMGVLPTITDGFCTDEDVPDLQNTKLSAECSRDDATSDPFGYFLRRLNRAVDLVISRGTETASAWKAQEMATFIDSTVRGLAFY
ncbi:MAG: hypothetical protein FJ112_06485, partial [Deltaproteobacteria bacterium]|nr:hypothetical protein [Deltaproteobacteria bacterium]